MNWKEKIEAQIAELQLRAGFESEGPQEYCHNEVTGWTKPLGHHACPDETATVVNNQWVCHCPK
jgi:hypothetical protein